MSTRLVALSLLLLAPVVVVAATPPWAASVGLDVWNVPALQAEVEKQVEVERDLHANADDIRRRIEIKEMLVADLIAGRASLADVTAQFLALNQAHPSYLDALRTNYPAGSDEETTARAVLGFVAARLTDKTSDRRAEVMTRLETEFGRLGDPHSPPAE